MKNLNPLFRKAFALLITVLIASALTQCDELKPTHSHSSPPQNKSAHSSSQGFHSKENLHARRSCPLNEEQFNNQSSTQFIQKNLENVDARYWITIKAIVSKMLKPDLKGSRHQRFIVRLPNRITLLVAHNISLAPEVPIGIGDTVLIHGEYIWNDKGGLLHWTHRDTRKNISKGWIQHKGQCYE